MTDDLKNKVMPYLPDLPQPCPAMVPEVNCSAIVPTSALFFSAVPVFSSKNQSEYEAAFAPLCSKIADYAYKVKTTCTLDPDGVLALARLQSEFARDFPSIMAAGDKAVEAIWNNNKTKQFEAFVTNFNVSNLKKIAVDFDGVVYEDFYPLACNGGGGWPFDGGMLGFNFWMLAMLTGVVLHLPPAMVTWHLVNRYATIMYVTNAKIEKPAGVNGGVVTGKALL